MAWQKFFRDFYIIPALKICVENFGEIFSKTAIPVAIYP